MWGLPGPGIELLCPKSQGGFFTTGPPGKPEVEPLPFSLKSRTFLAVDLVSQNHHPCHRWRSGEEPTYQRKRQKRRKFDPWVRKIPWRRSWHPLQCSCLENPHGQRSLEGYGPRLAKSQTQQKQLSTHASSCLLQPLLSVLDCVQTSSSHKDPSPIALGLTLMTSFLLTYLFRYLSPNPVPSWDPRVRVPTYGFLVGDTIQPITLLMRFLSSLKSHSSYIFVCVLACF